MSGPRRPCRGSGPRGAAYEGASSSGTAPLALANNRDIRAAALRVEKARALYRIQRVDILPTVDATASGHKERVPADLSAAGRATTVEQYGVDLGISAWEIDFFGRIRSLEKKALAQYLATDAARRSARILLMSEVADAYITLGADAETLELAQYTLKTRRETYDLIRKRFEGGMTPELDLRQAQTRVDAARVDVARYTAFIAKDRNALNLLAGAPVPPDLLPRSLSEVLPMPEVSAGTPSDVLSRRPDILRAERLLKAANADIGAARAAFFPRISLTAAVGTTSKDLSGLFEPGSDVWRFAPQVALPIFAPATWYALDVGEAEKKILVAEYEGAIQSAFRDGPPVPGAAQIPARNRRRQGPHRRSHGSGPHRGGRADHVHRGIHDEGRAQPGPDRLFRDVMKESAQAALSYLRSHTETFGIDNGFFEDHDIHIHVPAGAIPKDGPSAGFTLAVALSSLLTQTPCKRQVAMTGELTLTGRILPVGGMKEKLLAAHRSGVTTAIFPEKNRHGLVGVPDDVKEDLEIVFADEFEEVVGLALKGWKDR